jgi:uracil-DNA glycosylase
LQKRAAMKHEHEPEPGTPEMIREQPAQPRELGSPASAAVVVYVPSPNPMPIAARPASATKQVVAKSEVLRPAYVSPADPERAARIAALDWAGLGAEAENCQACGLCKQRKQAVFGVGAKDAPWLFIGEGPGAEEDQQGEPFVGQAGQLLEAMFAAAGLRRGREVYIANVVKCRPPGNRTPTAEEALACAPLLDRQIELIKPKILVALGKTAAVRLTASEASMASLRGHLHSYGVAGNALPVVATYHPAYLLRNPPDKLKAWEDLIFAKKAMSAMKELESN